MDEVTAKWINMREQKIQEQADEIERLRTGNRLHLELAEIQNAEIERLREENEKLLRNAKQDAEMMMAYNRICQKHGFAPSSSDLIAALQQKESE